MNIEVKLPEVSENVDSGDVVSVLVKVGEVIKLEQPVVELETDKAMFEVPSTAAGKVKEILVKPGDNIKVGSTIIVVDSGETESDISEQKPEEVIAKPLPEAKEEISEPVTQVLPESKPETKENDKHDIVKPAEEIVSGSPKSSDDINIYTKPIPASPRIRRLARELGVNLINVTGTGPAGRISENDVKEYVKNLMSGTGITISSPAGSIPQQPLPDFSKWGEIETVSMSKIRKVTAANMSYAWNSVPMVTQFDKADITELEIFRKKLSPGIEKLGGQLTVTSILLKVCSVALKKFPQFNSSIDFSKSEIILKKYYNIGVAVDTENGLLVPVVKNVDRKNLTELSVELTELAKQTRERKITPAEMEGGNFTISNLGGIGGTAFTPIVYAPQVAILGVSRATTEAKYIDGEFKPRLILPLTLTYDHRIIDGADAARYLRWICESLEQPMTMML